jgi:hypothetical protein
MSVYGLNGKMGGCTRLKKSEMIEQALLSRVALFINTALNGCIETAFRLI